jgi:REP element-mobilizing transposase RayT
MVKTPPRQKATICRMAIKYKHSNEYSTYFVTFTCFKWLSLFEITNSYDIVYNWFSILKENAISVIGYVIMPNHVHVIVYFHKPSGDLNKVISNAKRFMAYEIINRLEKNGNEELLQLLSASVTKREINKGQKHKVFTSSFDAKSIYSDKFLFQKLNYIHANPVTGKWALAKDYVSYDHSSAAFYELDKATHFTPTHFRDL